jgi:hypothetical protein
MSGESLPSGVLKVAEARLAFKTNAYNLRGYIDSLSGDAFQGAIRALNVLHDSFDAALASPPPQATGALSEERIAGLLADAKASLQLVNQREDHYWRKVDRCIDAALAASQVERA